MLKIKLVFYTWTKEGKDVYNTEEGIELSKEDFHSGTTFDGKIEIDWSQNVELQGAFKRGYFPVFTVLPYEN